MMQKFVFFSNSQQTKLIKFKTTEDFF